MPLERASSRFATVYAAGELAISLGVLDWNRGELRKAILSCQLDGLKEITATKEGKSVPATTEASIRTIGRKLMEFFRQNQSKSMDLRRRLADSKQHKFGSVPYYIATHKGHKYFYLTANALNSAIGTGADAKRYKQSLVDRKFLDVSTGGKGGRRFVVERKIFNEKGKKGMKWVHALKVPIKT